MEDTKAGENENSTSANRNDSPVSPLLDNVETDTGENENSPSPNDNHSPDSPDSPLLANVETDTEESENLTSPNKNDSPASSLLGNIKLAFEMSPRPRIQLYTVDQYNASLSQSINQQSKSTSAEDKDFCSCESSRENYYSGPIKKNLELKRLMNRKKKVPPKLKKGKGKRLNAMKKKIPAVKAKKKQRRNQVQKAQDNGSATSEPDTEAASEVGILTTFPPNTVAGAQAAIGCTFGCIGGIIDHAFSDRYGILVGFSLVVLQAMDRRAGHMLPWNKGLKGHVRESKHTQDCTMGKMVEEVTAFTVDNAYMATGFAGGYLLGNVIADACRNIN